MKGAFIWFLSFRLQAMKEQDAERLRIYELAVDGIKCYQTDP